MDVAGVLEGIVLATLVLVIALLSGDGQEFVGVLNPGCTTAVINFPLTNSPIANLIGYACGK